MYYKILIKLIMISAGERLNTIIEMYVYENCLLSLFPVKYDYRLMGFFNKIHQTEKDIPMLDQMHPL